MSIVHQQMVGDQIKVGEVVGPRLLSQIPCLDLVDNLDDVFVVFASILSLDNQVRDIKEDEKALVDDTLLFHSTHELAQHLALRLEL